MRSPIGLYLTEFQPGSRRGFTPSSTLDDLPSFALEPSFGLEDGGFQTEPEDEPFGEVAFEPMADMDAIPDEAPAPEPDLSAAIETPQADPAAALAEARQQWAAQEGAALAVLIEGQLTEFENRLAAALTPLLEPFLAKAAQLKVLDQLRETLGTLLAGGEQRTITVKGPADLIDAIRQTYPGRVPLAFEETDEIDVTIAVGETRIRSQLRAWARKLDTALGARA